MEINALSLYELNLSVKNTIKSAFAAPVWIIAEISEIKENRNGHCYLELIEKDENGTHIKARSRGIIWAYTYRMLKPYFETTTGQMLQAGIKILVHVTVEFHEQYGFSLEIKDIEPSFTIGDIEKQKQEILERLMQEGVMDMNKQTELPLCPQKIAIISSPTAAGFTDFINQLENNPYGYVFYTKLFPTVMQGTETEESMSIALERIYQYENLFDAVVIIRGGGASIDLNCFNNYNLAYLVTQFPIPVLTGIGHEKDETILDIVSFQKLKTPTAVAEYLVDRLADFEAYMDELTHNFFEHVSTSLHNQNKELTLKGHKLTSMISKIISSEKLNTEKLANRLPRLTDRFFQQNQSLLKQQLHTLATRVPEQIKNKRNQLLKAGISCQKNSINYLKTKHLTLTHQQKTTEYLNPKNILKRGYSVTLKDGKPVLSVNSLKKGDEIETLLHQGRVKSTVKGNDSSKNQ